MGAIVEFTKKLYRALLPPSVRDSAIVARLKTRVRGHDWVYDADYFDTTIEAPAARSAGPISESIVNDLQPSSVIDVGCGTGALLEALRDRGCDVFGLEYADAALKYCRNRQLNVEKFDIERNDLTNNRTFDVATSMEVAEHLPGTVADRYVDLLTRIAPVVVFTAAQPGQGGADHVNEQPSSYWIEKFERRGFAHDKALSQSWRESWQAADDVEHWYYRNLMVFRRSQVT